ncbi:hypothetical protein Sango_3091300 [Sesamum angolense]|uniref:Uncharacterized protein n=1 Tax=Sesamum angolense TaxID=2727404 RepID=A0AAE1TAK1_9LAMI|nr:hypothetical protein Sango_3091300 [Sesamum angolense]
MSRHLWSVIKHEKESLWVEWIAHYRLRDAAIWTVNAKRGAWSWRKMLELRGTLLPHSQLRIGTRESFSLWHDPWHNLGPLILRFPRGPQLTGTAPMATLSVVIEDNMWSWHLITDIAHLEIIQNLPPIHNGCDAITWDSNGGDFTNSVAYHLFRPPGPKLAIWGGYPLRINHGCNILMDTASYVLMGVWRRMTTYSLIAGFPNTALLLSDDTSDSNGLMWSGNVASCGHVPMER